MARTIRFSKVIRGVEVEIEASDFDGDPSVGINYGPECVSARTLDGDDFQLTDDESEQLGIQASAIYYEDGE